MAARPRASEIPTAAEASQRQKRRGSKGVVAAGASLRRAAKLLRTCPQRATRGWRLAPCQARLAYASGPPSRLVMTSANPAVDTNAACATSSSSVDRPKHPKRIGNM